MPTCQHCNHSWTYGNTIKKLFRIKLLCPYCSEINYITAKAQWRISFYGWLPSLAIPFFAGFNVPIMWSITYVMIILLVAFGGYPFIAELSKEREYLV